METMNALVTGQLVGQPVATTLSFNGWNVAVLQVGVDYKLPYVSIGPFVTFDLGRFSSVSLSNTALTETHTTQDLAWHEWLTLGLRGYFDIFIGRQQPSPWRTCPDGPMLGRAHLTDVGLESTQERYEH
jgi:hypothetical protein